MRRLALLLVAALLAAAPAPVFAAAGPNVSYRPPVDGPIVDEFRSPPNPYGAGNRGIDYATQPGGPVRSAADGEVTFAGQVGGFLHVVVLHADGVRTSYSFLRTVAVRRGERVRQGQIVGTSESTLHFGARVGDTYIDPRLLFDEGPPNVHLVPDEARRPAPEAQERSAVARLLGSFSRDRLARAYRDGAGRLAGGASWLSDRFRAGGSWALDWGRQYAAEKLHELRGVLHYAESLRPVQFLAAMAHAAQTWQQQRGRCTPASVRPPPLPERRVAVLVGGLGSSSDSAAIDDVDTAGLGYRPGEVMRFSYLGGTTAENAYDPNDTTVDLRESARRLRDLLEEVHAANPGVPVDIIAHSQGGLVARQAMAFEYDPDDPDLPPVANLVTLGTPHHGADLGTAAAMMGSSLSGELVQRAHHLAFSGSFDLRGDSMRQLSEASEFIRKLNRREVPAGTRVTSIGARGDLIVPAVRTHVDGANNAIVSLPGALTDHDQLPGSPAAHREVALALAGMSPTCQTLRNMMADEVVSTGISMAEDALGAGLYLGGQAADGAAGGVLADLFTTMRRNQ